MNKLMKKLTAALIALACVPVMGITVQAEKLGYYWGTTTWDAFAELEPYDDHGMYSRSQMGKEQLFLRKSSNDTGSIIFVTPRTNTVCFVLRDDVDVDAAADQIAEIVDAYIPGIRDGKVTWESNPESWHIYSCAQAQLFNTGFGGIRTYSLELEDVIPDKASVEAGILLGLAKKHLISEFYGWGQTADYYTGYVNQTDLGDKFLLSYSPTHTIENPDPNNGKGNWLTVETDWDAVQVYLDEHHPGYTVTRFAAYSYIVQEDDGTTRQETYYNYRIMGAEEKSFREQLDLAVELWENLGLDAPGLIVPESGGETTVGHNALEQPGDVDLDTDINILDVIAANKDFMGAELLDCDTAKKNGDINGNGKVDATDSLAILKYIVGINETL